MTNRARKILAWTPLVLISVFLLVASALPKLFMSYEGSPLQPSIEALGVWDIIQWIGVLELACAVLLLIPRTQTVGFILTVGLLGGATATSLTHPEAQGAWWWFPLALLLLLSVSAYFLLPELLDRLFKRPVPRVSLWLRILGWASAVLIFAFNAMTAVFKYMPIEPGSEAEAMTKQLGILSIQHYLGVLQILVTILFIIPRTSTVGFVLMVGYWGGVFATNLSHGFQSLPEVMPMIITFLLLTLSAIGRNPELTTRLFKGNA
jgi:hypothetical protein